MVAISRHKKGWDRIYHQRRPKSLPWELGRPREILVDIVESNQIMPSITLDLCCGMGTNPIYLAKKGFDVTVIDISDKAIEYAKNKANIEKVEINLIVADHLNLPFSRKQFDFVFDFGCFHHVKSENRKSFIKNVHRVLKPKAIFFMVCFSYKNGLKWNHFTKKQLDSLLKNCFKIEWIKHFSSLEGDGIIRYFYQIFMYKR